MWRVRRPWARGSGSRYGIEVDGVAARRRWNPTAAGGTDQLGDGVRPEAADVSPVVEAAAVEAAVARLPPRLRGVAERLMRRWPGRFVVRTAASVARIELFDRSMAIAAQVFTSVFPILILIGSWVPVDDDDVAATLGIPDETRSVLDEAIGADAATATTFGIVGTLIVLISATSLSRALTRAYAAIYNLPRPRTNLGAAWRWAAAVVALAISLVAVRLLAQAVSHLPPPEAWEVAVALLADVAIALFLPWVLLAGAIPVRVLVPAALLYAVAMVPIRTASRIWFPLALESSAEKYGAIGVAFASLAWLYVIAFCLLAVNVIGYVLATDDSPLGRWIRTDTSPSPT
jgi:membrane protein